MSNATNSICSKRAKEIAKTEDRAGKADTHLLLYIHIEKEKVKERRSRRGRGRQGVS